MMQPMNTSLTDVIAIVGQSNACGAALDGNAKPAPRVYQWACDGPDRHTIIAATEPLQHPWPADYSFGTRFGDLHSQHYDRDVLLVPVAKSGTPLRAQAPYDKFTWAPGWTPPIGGANMLDLAVEEITAAMTAAGPDARLAAFVWVHGESDGVIGTTREQYRDTLVQIVHELRTRIAGANSTPFVAAQMVPEGIIDVPGRIQTHHGTLDAVALMENSGFAYSPWNSYRRWQGKPDTTHFAASGQDQVAARLFDALLRVNGEDPASSVGAMPDPGPELRPRSVTQRAMAKLRRR